MLKFTFQYWDKKIAVIAQRYANSCPRGHDTSEDRSVEGILELLAFRPKLTKQVFHTISLELISKRSTSKSFHEPSVQFVRIDVIGRFGGRR